MSGAKRQKTAEEDGSTDSSEEIELTELPQRPSKRYSCSCLRCNGKLVSFQTKRAHLAIMESLNKPAMQTRSKGKVREEYQNISSTDMQDDHIEFQPLLPNKCNKHFKLTQSPELGNMFASQQFETEEEITSNKDENGEISNEYNSTHFNISPFTAPIYDQHSDTYKTADMNNNYI